MKNLFLFGAMLCMVGCGTTSQTTAFNTIGSIEATGQAAYDAYAMLVIKGTVSTNALPQVAAEYNQFQSDVILAATVSAQGTNGLAPAALTADLAALATAVSTASTIK